MSKRPGYTGYTGWQCQTCGATETHKVNADMWGEAGVTKCCATPDWLGITPNVPPPWVGCAEVYDEESA